MTVDRQPVHNEMSSLGRWSKLIGLFLTLICVVAACGSGGGGGASGTLTGRAAILDLTPGDLPEGWNELSLFDPLDARSSMLTRDDSCFRDEEDAADLVPRYPEEGNIAYSGFRQGSFGPLLIYVVEVDVEGAQEYLDRVPELIATCGGAVRTDDAGTGTLADLDQYGDQTVSLFYEGEVTGRHYTIERVVRQGDTVLALRYYTGDNDFEFTADDYAFVDSVIELFLAKIG